MSNSGASRVSIPDNVRKTIQNIQEITGNHSEEDIYEVLKDCFMDPSETIQRLLHLDTFHEVKRKRRKETVKSRIGEESRWKPGHQGRGTKGSRGNSFSQYTSNDAGGRRNAAFRKENGLEESIEKGFRHSLASVSKETDSVQQRNVEKLSSITVDEPIQVPNGGLNGGHGVQSSRVGDAHLSKENINASVDETSCAVPKASAVHAPASDPVLLPSCDFPVPTAVGAIKREVQIHDMSAEVSSPVPADEELDTTESASNSHLNKHEPQTMDGSRVASSMSEKEAFKLAKVAQQKSSGECPVAESSHIPESISVAKPSSPQGVKDAASELEKLKFSDGQHVIIPNHIQVPDAVKKVLSFGSLDASFGVRESYMNSESNGNSSPAADPAHEGTVSKPSLCDQDAVSTVPQANHADDPQSPSRSPGKNSSVVVNVSSSATVPKDDQLLEENLPAVGPPFPVQNTPSYSFGVMPPMSANALVQPEVFESQAHVSNSLNGSSPVISTSTSTPPPTQSVGTGQSSIAMSPQPISLFRQPYPPNYIPYSHYYPFYVPPTLHQYFGHTTFPPPLPTSNVYLPPPSAPAGMKISPAHYKMGTNTGTQGPVGLPSGYGAYSSQVGYSQNATVTSGNSSTGEDLGPPALKESNIHTGQQGEVPAVWIPAAGRETASFPLNSFLNLPPHGQPLLTPQSGHGAFAVYHALHPMATPAPGLPLLQQSQPVAGSVESMGPPSNSYQQPPQRQQPINWNV